MDTVISLQGICRNAPHLCDDATEGELDRVHLVIGKLANPRVYSFVVFDFDQETGKFEPLQQLSTELTDRLNRLGISVKPDENGAVPIYGRFWPSISGNVLNSNFFFELKHFFHSTKGQPYFKAGVFLSARGEVFFNYYDSNLKDMKNYIRHGRISSTSAGMEYEPENLSESYDNLGFVGMFYIGEKVYGIDGENMVYEILSGDRMSLMKKVCLICNCLKHPKLTFKFNLRAKLWNFLIVMATQLVT